MTVITPFFAAVLALIYIGLSLNVVRYRIDNRLSSGSGGDAHVEMAIRAHANFIEYVPLALLLMWFIESLTLSGNLVFWLGAVLVVARTAHAFGMFYPKQLLVLRQLGAIGTFGVILVASLAILRFYLPL